MCVHFHVAGGVGDSSGSVWPIYWQENCPDRQEPWPLFDHRASSWTRTQNLQNWWDMVEGMHLTRSVMTFFVLCVCVCSDSSMHWDSWTHAHTQTRGHIYAWRSTAGITRLSFWLLSQLFSKMTPHLCRRLQNVILLLDAVPQSAFCSFSLTLSCEQDMQHPY